MQSPSSPTHGTADQASPEEDEPQQHQRRSSANPKSRRGLRRSVAACERCRRRKQKCDGKVPTCSNCAASGNPCVPSQRLIIQDPSCDCVALREQVRSLEAKIASLERGVGPRVDQAGNLDPISTGGIPPAHDIGQHLHQRAGYCPNAARILRPTFPRRDTSEYPQSGLLGSPWHLWGSSIGAGADGAAATAPDTSSMSQLWEDGNELVDIFFARRWPQLPVLHRDTFMRQDFAPLSQGLPGRDLSPFLVNIVFAIAAIEKNSRFHAGSGTAIRGCYFQAAANDIGAVLAADDLDCIQCLLLLVMYGINEPQSVNLWFTIGLALRLAISLDMHRQEVVVGQNVLQVEMRKRLWWCVYVMDRSISMALNRPLGIQDSDVTTPLPEAIRDDLLDPTISSPVLPLPHAIIPDTRDVSAFIHTVKLRRLNTNVYNTFHAAGKTGLEATEMLESIRLEHYIQLTDWLANAPRYLTPSSMFQTPEWFQIAYHHAIITLYRPSHAFPTTTLDAVRLCADASISLLACYSTLHAKNKLSYSFVALNSLFMAAVTMLHALRTSRVLRQDLGRTAVERNVGLATSLLRDISSGRAVGDYSARIIERLGGAVLSSFDGVSGMADEEVDTEFLTWFGLKSQQQEVAQPGQPTPSTDIAWNDLLTSGFDMSGMGWTDLLV